LAALLPTESTIQKARDLLAAHRAAKAQVKLKRLMAKADSKALADKLPPEARKRIEGILEARDALAELSEPPLPPLAPLLTELSWAVAFGVRSSDLEVVCRAAEREVRKRLDEHHPPPADGTFAVTVVGQPGRAATAFTTWNPHSGLPPYAEVRAAVERTVPSAFARPRRVGAHPPPYFEQTAGPEADLAVTAASFDFPDPWRLEELAELPEPDIPDYEIRAGRVRQLVGVAGFEAIAWYQSHHFFTDDSWGIYVDAERVDDLVCAVADDFIREGFARRPFSIAQAIVPPMVFEHELFHARVDAVLTWTELLRPRPGYMPYFKNVYVPTRDTDGATEEALANFWASSSVFTELNLRWLTGLLNLKERETLERVINALLDLSPPGYRDWRSGRSPETWRRFGTQALRANTRSLLQGAGLPVESVFRDSLQFLFRSSDVPVHVIGSGQAVRGLLSFPAIFNVPSRSELRRVLEKVFGYSEVPGQGKGSHVKFVGPDGRVFPLPRKDPVSRTVFAAFLEHFRLSKSEYVGSVRAQI
jgi:hypothetical protein